MAARKPKSFYSNALDEAERLELKAALNQEGIDDEIAVMRVQIKRLVKSADIEELARCMTVLCRLVATRYATTKADKRGIKEAIGNVLREIVLPLGIKVGEALIEKKL